MNIFDEEKMRMYAKPLTPPPHPVYAIRTHGPRPSPSVRTCFKITLITLQHTHMPLYIYIYIYIYIQNDIP